MQAPPPGRRASRHRRGFRSEGSPCADESTVALRHSTPTGELCIRVRQCSGMSPEPAVTDRLLSSKLEEQNTEEVQPDHQNEGSYTETDAHRPHRRPPRSE